MKRLVASAVGCLLTGCLIPFPIEEAPAEVNLPPSINEGTVFPPQGIIDYDPCTDDAQLFFEVGGVDDPNPDDVLFVRWFVDSRIDFLADQTPGERGQPLIHSYGPCSQSFAADETLQKVELVVSDRPFVEGVTQDVPADAGVRRVIWFVSLDFRRCLQRDDADCGQ